MSCLSDIKKCIQKIALIEGKERNYLEEKATKTKILLNTEGQYLLYDFERIKQPLFPFFESNEDVKGLNAIADKILFTEDNKGKIWVFIIELKQGKGSPQNQLFATKQLIIYILESINRTCKTDYKAELRGLGYSKKFRPTTKQKTYDKHNNAYFCGERLILSNYQDY